MAEAHVFITDDTLRKALHETIDRQRERITMLEGALEAAETQALAEMDRVYGEAVDYAMLARSLERLRADNARLRTELNAALDALRAAPKPPWNFRPTIGWQGVYCDWHEAQVALVKGDNDT